MWLLFGLFISYSKDFLLVQLMSALQHVSDVFVVIQSFMLEACEQDVHADMKFGSVMWAACIIE